MDIKEKEGDICNEIWDSPDPDLFPGILLSKEVNEYLNQRFRNKFLNKGYFKNMYDREINKRFKEAGFIDPEREYMVYGAVPDVFLIDKNRIGDRKIPRTREDLLDPIYKDEIVIFAKDKNDLSNLLLLYIFRDFGEEGLNKLAHNVKLGIHGSIMSKTAGTNSRLAGSIYIVSHFFASTCLKDNMEIIWAEDGAMSYPLYMLVRKDKLDRVKDI